MTNEQAINWLIAIKEKYIHGGDDGFDELRKEALDMAIKALKEERPQGEWLPLSDISSSGFGTWVCSQCCQGFRGIKSKMPYCTCGAKMSNGGTDMGGEE